MNKYIPIIVRNRGLVGGGLWGTTFAIAGFFELHRGTKESYTSSLFREIKFFLPPSVLVGTLFGFAFHMTPVAASLFTVFAVTVPFILESEERELEIDKSKIVTVYHED